MLLSQLLNWNLLAFLPVLSYSDLEHHVKKNENNFMHKSMSVQEYFREFKGQDIWSVRNKFPRKNFWNFILAWNSQK